MVEINPITLFTNPLSVFENRVLYAYPSNKEEADKLFNLLLYSVGKSFAANKVILTHKATKQELTPILVIYPKIYEMGAIHRFVFATVNNLVGEGNYYIRFAERVICPFAGCKSFGFEDQEKALETRVQEVLCLSRIGRELYGNPTYFHNKIRNRTSRLSLQNIEDFYFWLCDFEANSDDFVEKVLLGAKQMPLKLQKVLALAGYGLRQQSRRVRPTVFLRCKEAIKPYLLELIALFAEPLTFNYYTNAKQDA